VSFRHGNYEAMQKMFNVGEADFLPADWVWSSILKPKTVHANWRYFEMYDDNGMWFSNGLVADRI
jgi:coproporphyrinogen III oxidase